MSDLYYVTLDLSGRTAYIQDPPRVRLSGSGDPAWRRTFNVAAAGRFSLESAGRIVHEYVAERPNGTPPQVVEASADAEVQP